MDPQPRHQLPCESPSTPLMITGKRLLNNQVEHDQLGPANSQLYMMRPTFYNPPKYGTTVAVLPHHLFGRSNTFPLSPAPSSPQHHDHSELARHSWPANQENISPTATATSVHEPQQDDKAGGAECDDLIDDYLTMEEADAVYINEQSVGTKIKHNALKIFRRWKDGELVTDQQLHWMACGLSSIWDLTNVKLAQEFLECSFEDMEHLTRPFITKYKCTQYQPPATFDQTLAIAASIIDKENNARKAIEYVQNVKTRFIETQKLLQVITVIVHIIESNRFLLDQDNIDRVTEYDFITQVWASLLKSLLDIHGILRMKVGESSTTHGVIARKRSYSEACVGFKVDLRLLYDSRQNEHDLLAMEVAKDGSTSKIYADVCKLMREAKDNLDDTLQHILKNKVASLPSSWYDPTLYAAYLAQRGLHEATMVAYYRDATNTTGTNPLIRKLELNAYIKLQLSNKRLVHNLLSTHGQDAVFILGDWSAGSMRFHAPIRGIGMRRMLAHEHLEVYLLDEYTTSKICPTCQSPTRLRPYLQVENPRPFRRAQYAFVRCWGLLRCTHCVSALAMDGLQVQGHHWNRDVLACT
ncbi:hypothetical protein DM01DRAFT_1372122 [Hesseltinella vesiculosa]|uniref:Uncharacterized protein n=1 Tax=Hesseltinella vesiculosa TaxID=101127 RepID=A0A1X2GQ06_9FUNG|nr:hypothetical protein DM01DRAFT_1372122 [Hesseltinella vesiculosa]